MFGLTCNGITVTPQMGCYNLRKCNNYGVPTLLLDDLHVMIRLSQHGRHDIDDVQPSRDCSSGIKTSINRMAGQQPPWVHWYPKFDPRLSSNNRVFRHLMELSTSGPSIHIINEEKCRHMPAFMSFNPMKSSVKSACLLAKSHEDLVSVGQVQVDQDV
jgi:hypothetical protein